MDREDITNNVLNIPNKNILLELATSVGKSKIAIEVCKKEKAHKILIVIPKLILISNWKDEIRKWWKENKCEFTFTTYISFPKHADNYDAIIFDEVHHLSQRCRDCLDSFQWKKAILLSATVKNSHRFELKQYFNNLECIKISARVAIDNNILPDPKVILIPLQLDNERPTEKLVINSNIATSAITVPYNKIWTARKDKKHKYIVTCTQRQYYYEISNMITWYKNKYMSSRNEFIKNTWLRRCADRLKWLSNQKNQILYDLLHKQLKNQRVLTFCNSIEQTELLSSNCINSKNKYALSIKDKFNSGKISHITAVDMLNEGVNLVDCRIGLYASLNSSATIVKQKLGRLLRHKSPIIIIPYFERTREDELVDVMLEDYNPELVTTINSVNELKI